MVLKIVYVIKNQHKCIAKLICKNPQKLHIYLTYYLFMDNYSTKQSFLPKII